MLTRLHSLINRENLLGLLVGACVFGVVAFAMPRFHSAKNGKVNEGLIGFDPPSFNFGRVNQAETVRHEFKLVNRSANEMRVVAIRSSCQCTLIEKDTVGKGIAPKGFLLVPVEFQSGSQQGSGNSKVEALLESQGQRYYAAAFMEGYVEADFEIKPRALNFGTIRAGEKATQAITLMGRLEGLTAKPRESTATLKISLRTNTAHLSSKLIQFDVAFEAPLVTRSEIFAGVITVETSSKLAPILSIPVSAVIRPELEIAPEVIVLEGNGTSGESRFTIRTLKPSRVIHAVVTKNKIAEEVSAMIDPVSSEEIWDLTHVRQIANSSLAGAERINFEMEIRSGTARTEARSVSIQIKCL